MGESYSLTLVTRKRVWFRHPWARIFTTLFIIAMDFYIYAEDPIQDSEAMAYIPIMGNVITFVGTKCHGNQGKALKGCLVALFMVLGLILGKKVVHQWLLRDKLHLNMFEEDKGSFIVMFFSTILSLYVGSLLYNAIIRSTELNAVLITSSLGCSNRTFGKVAQCFTWLGDLVTVVMVWDSMFQDFQIYPEWAPKWKQLWTKGCGGKFRVAFVWVGVVGSTAGVYYGILHAGEGGQVDWGEINKRNGTNELGRVVAVSIIVVVDLFIVFQDWQFPTFDDALCSEVMIAGTFQSQLRCDCLERALQGCRLQLLRFDWFRALVQTDFFSVVVTGKWINYGPLFIIICFDLNMMKNQVLYVPVNYGQYTDPATFIWTIKDQHFLAQAGTNESLISWQNRQGGASGDVAQQARFVGVSMVAKGGAVIPALLALLLFWLAVFRTNHSVPQRNRDIAIRRASIAERQDFVGQEQMGQLNGKGKQLRGVTRSGDESASSLEFKQGQVDDGGSRLGLPFSAPVHVHFPVDDSETSWSLAQHLFSSPLSVAPNSPSLHQNSFVRIPDEASFSNNSVAHISPLWMEPQSTSSLVPGMVRDDDEERSPSPGIHLLVRRSSPSSASLRRVVNATPTPPLHITPPPNQGHLVSFSREGSFPSMVSFPSLYPSSSVQSLEGGATSVSDQFVSTRHIPDGSYVSPIKTHRPHRSQALVMHTNTVQPGSDASRHSGARSGQPVYHLGCKESMMQHVQEWCREPIIHHAQERYRGPMMHHVQDRRNSTISVAGHTKRSIGRTSEQLELVARKWADYNPHMNNDPEKARLEEELEAAVAGRALPSNIGNVRDFRYRDVQCLQHQLPKSLSTQSAPCQLSPQHHSHPQCFDNFPSPAIQRLDFEGHHCYPASGGHGQGSMEDDGDSDISMAESEITVHTDM
eukprot:gb/GEZN01001591.1/.p1 GENE.gb/GEZN01001591.1/~~gb/GEZN01001591.1/.p1  ORF type:complete len:922 (+),score=53.32 gb/GEZN01001591.1/:137-2902(+)